MRFGSGPPDRASPDRPRAEIQGCLHGLRHDDAAREHLLLGTIVVRLEALGLSSLKFARSRRLLLIAALAVACSRPATLVGTELDARPAPDFTLTDALTTQ